MPRQKPRRTDLDTRLRNMTEILGRPGLAGLSRVGGQFSGAGGGGQSVLINATTESNDAGQSAQLLVMSATTDSIASGGDYVTFGAIVDQRGFDGVPVQAGDDWMHPVSGVYVLAFDFEWDTYEAGGTIALELDGTVARTITTGSTGAQAFDVIGYYAEADQVGKLKVTQSSGSAQTCDATIQIMVSDPDQADQPVNWTQVTSSDVYDLTWDGSSWFTTEGSSGMTVSERSTAWAETASFEASAIDTGGDPGPVRGVTFDGTDLWLVGESNLVVARYSTAGVLQSQFDPSWGSETGISGISYDGSDLWVTGNATKELRRYSTAGVLQQTEAVPTSNLIAACAYYNGRIYVADTTDGVLLVYRVATDAWETSIDVSGATTTPTGVWISDTGTLHVCQDGSGVWQRNTVVA